MQTIKRVKVNGINPITVTINLEAPFNCSKCGKDYYNSLTGRVREGGRLEVVEMEGSYEKHKYNCV